MTTSFLCGTCGELHEGLPTDWAWRLPDEVWALSKDERDARAKWTDDLCQLDERYFIRCILKVPFQELEGYYGWGVWAEVAENDFRRYLEVYSEDASREPPVPGTLANAISQYEAALGLPISVQFGNATSRPSVHVSLSTGHILAVVQAAGMSNASYHDILVSTGALGGP
mgnify:CR=1 FL=1